MHLSPPFRDVFSTAGHGNHTVIAPNLISCLPDAMVSSQEQTAQAFTDKWGQFEYGSTAFENMVRDQKRWYLELYGFADEATLAAYLQSCPVILDAGAGMGYKSAWFAELSPSSLIMAADICDMLPRTARHYAHFENICFVHCDIGDMPFFDLGCFDYISCDQVIHHTRAPAATFSELVRCTGAGRDVSVYVYRKKALPRELLDDHFRHYSKSLDHEQLMALSRQVTELGRLLSTVDEELDFPDVPALDIQGGKMTVQRFVYWNFLKCFWNKELGEQASVMTNYDWYAPSQALRFSEQEFMDMIAAAGLETIHFHKEFACYSGRFRKPAED